MIYRYNNICEYNGRNGLRAQLYNDIPEHFMEDFYQHMCCESNDISLFERYSPITILTYGKSQQDFGLEHWYSSIGGPGRICLRCNNKDRTEYNLLLQQ